MGNHNVLAVFPYWQSSLDVDEFKYELFMIRDWFRAFDADQAVSTMMHSMFQTLTYAISGRKRGESN